MKIDVLLNEAEFLRFGFFDALRYRKVWRAPALFAAILGVCGAVCLLRPGIRGSAVLGTVLLAVGLGLPAVWFLSFYLSLRRQAAKERLTPARPVYTLDLGEDGVAVDNGREQAVYPWAQVFQACRGETAVYLYVAPRKAFLIPDSCVRSSAERLWALISDRVPEERRMTAR